MANIPLWLHLLTLGPVLPAPDPLTPLQPGLFMNEVHLAEEIAQLRSWEQLISSYAELMHVEDSLISNTSLYFFLDDWLGTPYRYAGKDKHGIDCSGFTSRLYAEVYRKNIFGSAHSLQSVTVPVSKASLQEGDLLFFNTRGSGISHVGVYLQNGYFVHASTYRGITINHLEENYYKRTFRTAGRVE